MVIRIDPDGSSAKLLKKMIDNGYLKDSSTEDARRLHKHLLSHQKKNKPGYNRNQRSDSKPD